MERIAPAVMANVFVKASGVKSSPSCPESAKIGKNDTTTSERAKNMGRPTIFDELKIASTLSSCVNASPFFSSSSTSLGSTYEALNKLDSAFTFTFKALQISREINDDIGIIINQTNAANILVKQNRKLACPNFVSGLEPLFS